MDRFLLSDDWSQIGEYLTENIAEQVQHIHGCCHDIHGAVEHLRKNELEFMAVPPDNDYMDIDTHLPNYGRR